MCSLRQSNLPLSQPNHDDQGGNTRKHSSGGLNGNPSPALRAVLVVVGLLVCVSAGCRERNETAQSAVVLYSSVDETFLRNIIADYERRTGRKVQLVGDTEAGKTIGLVNRIRAEQDRPRADVWWSSEQSQTMLLAREGLLAPYESPTADDIRPEFRDEDDRWTGFALRARVVAYDPTRTPAETLPKNWEAYASAEWASRVAIAQPFFGTTRSHVAAMHAMWGDKRLRDFLVALKDGGATFADGNASAVRKLLDGAVEVAFTDSDDVITAQARGASVAMVYPDMGDGGTLVIPNTVALIAGAPHPDDARKLIDFIVSAEVEEALARSPSGNYPVRARLRVKLGIEPPAASTVGFAEIADHMQPAVAACREILQK
jgi:iron(III) transport system substrate-binding protein